MTELQKIVYEEILNNQPICDKCIAENLGFNNPQNANSACRWLRDNNYIFRNKKYCPKCNRSVIINTIKK
jgi:hypothetical protein